MVILCFCVILFIHFSSVCTWVLHFVIVDVGFVSHSKSLCEALPECTWHLHTFMLRFGFTSISRNMICVYSIVRNAMSWVRGCTRNVYSIRLSYEKKIAQNLFVSECFNSCNNKIGRKKNYKLRTHLQFFFYDKWMATVVETNWCFRNRVSCLMNSRQT